MSAADDTRSKILEAAMELIAERGYVATTTRAIAERAGVNEVTLFRHFESKAGVLRAIGERFADLSAASQMRELPDPSDVRATLCDLARTEIATSLESGGVALRLAFEARSVPEIAELMGEGPRANLDGLSAYFAERQSAGAVRDDIAPAMLAEAFSSLTSSYVMYRTVMGFIDRPDPDELDRTVGQLVDIFWTGAAGREE